MSAVATGLAIAWSPGWAKSADARAPPGALHALPAATDQRLDFSKRERGKSGQGG